jgi:hypothetical protein
MAVMSELDPEVVVTNIWFVPGVKEEPVYAPELDIDVHDRAPVVCALVPLLEVPELDNDVHDSAPVVCALVPLLEVPELLIEVQERAPVVCALVPFD